MFRSFKKDCSPLRFALPGTVIAVLGALSLLLAIAAGLLGWVAWNASAGRYLSFLLPFARFLLSGGIVFSVFSALLFVLAVVVHIRTPDRMKMAAQVRKALLSHEFGNPLGLKEGQRLPKVRCTDKGAGVYEISISAVSSTIEQLEKVSSSISSALSRKYSQYAVSQTDADIAYNEIRFLLTDVTVDRSLTVHFPEEMKQADVTKLIVQDGTYIDLTTSGSMLVAGKTRSGKTTAVIALLMQVLMFGPDKHGSLIMIIDPKRAELSRLPYTYTLDEDGKAKKILKAIRRFVDTVRERQQYLNKLSEKIGDAVKWWKVGMHPCFLFIDEYVGLRSILPKRSTKDDPDYSLEIFDGLLQLIVTTGASAGCFVIISIAEASVQEGGLPSMIRSACSTKILFRPTLPEGRLMWDSDKLKDMLPRVYGPGDAWLSSTDGVHDNVCFVHFPVMDFQVYKELRRLLEEYFRTRK